MIHSTFREKGERSCFQPRNFIGAATRWSRQRGLYNVRTLVPHTAWFEIAVVLGWVVCVVAVQQAAAALTRRHRLSSFTARKLPHVVVGLLIVPLAVLVHRWQVAAIPVAMILGANAKANLRRAQLTAKVERIYPLVAFGAPAAVILFLWARGRTDLVVLGVLAMTIGDTAAAFAGMRFGKRRLPWTGKSLEGAAANAAASWITLAAAGALLYGMPPGAFVAPAIAAAAVEVALPGEWDNPVSILVVIGILLASTS
jgi:dolichol kinase